MKNELHDSAAVLSRNLRLGKCTRSASMIDTLVRSNKRLAEQRDSLLRQVARRCRIMSPLDRKRTIAAECEQAGIPLLEAEAILQETLQVEARR